LPANLDLQEFIVAEACQARTQQAAPRGAFQVDGGKRTIGLRHAARAPPCHGEFEAASLSAVRNRPAAGFGAQKHRHPRPAVPL